MNSEPRIKYGEWQTLFDPKTKAECSFRSLPNGCVRVEPSVSDPIWSRPRAVKFFKELRSLGWIRKPGSGKNIRIGNLIRRIAEERDLFPNSYKEPGSLSLWALNEFSLSETQLDILHVATVVEILALSGPPQTMLFKIDQEFFKQETPVAALRHLKTQWPTLNACILLSIIKDIYADWDTTSTY